jgi:hypothetical protein
VDHHLDSLNPSQHISSAGRNIDRHTFSLDTLSHSTTSFPVAVGEHLGWKLPNRTCDVSREYIAQYVDISSGLGIMAWCSAFGYGYGLRHVCERYDDLGDGHA